MLPLPVFPKVLLISPPSHSLFPSFSPLLLSMLGQRPGPSTPPTNPSPLLLSALLSFGSPLWQAASCSAMDRLKAEGIKLSNDVKRDKGEVDHKARGRRWRQPYIRSPQLLGRIK